MSGHDYNDALVMLVCGCLAQIGGGEFFIVIPNKFAWIPDSLPK